MKFIKKIEKTIHTKISPDIKVKLDQKGCLVLEGELEKWDDIVEAGSMAVSKKHLGVINNIKLKGFSEKPKMPDITDNLYDGKTCDILIIGAGICGCAVARELSKFNCSVMLIDKEYDVAMGASSRNDGDIHVGIDLHKGQAKLHYNLRGNKLYDKICEDLDVELHRTGHMIIFYKTWETLILYPLMKLKSKILGIEGLKFLKGKKLRAIESGTPSWAKGAVFMPTGAEISPYKATVALAENAAVNGVEVCLETAVTGMKVIDGKITEVQTNRGTIYPRLVVNAAGVYSDIIADMAGDRTFTIHPRKGTNLILDKKRKDFAATSMTKSPFSKTKEEKLLPKSKHTKGGGVVHTVDGNVLLGPTAIETPYREDITTERKDIDAVLNKTKIVAHSLQYSDIITYFSGVRAPTYEEDFVVRKGIFTKNIIEIAGIQSPGLTAAPAFAEDVAVWAQEILGEFSKKENFIAKRKAPPKLSSMPIEKRNELIKQNPDYGEIVCRCEEVSKGEIIDALNSPVPVYSLDAIKRRVRPGMGRCQGGFCSPLVLKILAEHKNCALSEITKGNRKGKILFGAKEAVGGKK